MTKRPWVLLLLTIFLAGCTPATPGVLPDSPAPTVTTAPPAPSTPQPTVQPSPIPSSSTPEPTVQPSPMPTSPPPQPTAAPAGDGIVMGWAVLAEKDNYDDVEMTNLPVDFAGIVQLRGLLEGFGWPAEHIRELREFDRPTLEEGLAWLAQQADADDLVFVYVAAHGMYLKNVLVWPAFFPTAWNAIPSRRQVLLIDSCQAANYTSAMLADPEPFVAIAAVDGDEYGWSGLPEEGLPIIGGVFTHYFVAAFAAPTADGDGNGLVSVQEAALWAEAEQRTYMHDVVFAVPEFREMYEEIGAAPTVQDPTFPDVIVDDTVGEPVYLAPEAYR
jgi:hypothetical protein